MGKNMCPLRTTVAVNMVSLFWLNDLTTACGSRCVTASTASQLGEYGASDNSLAPKCDRGAAEEALREAAKRNSLGSHRDATARAIFVSPPQATAKSTRPPALLLPGSGVALTKAELASAARVDGRIVVLWASSSVAAGNSDADTTRPPQAQAALKHALASCSASPLPI